MKNVYTYILKEDGSEKFHFVLAISRKQDPEIVIKKLLALRNNTLLPGEKPISLDRIRPNIKVCMEHDWVKVGTVYKCADCGVVGKRENPMLKICPVEKDKKYKDCGWKCKF